MYTKTRFIVNIFRGMGSMKTYLIHTEEELKTMLEEGVAPNLDGPIDFEVEEFVQGQMYHIDGFVEKYIRDLCKFSYHDIVVL